MAQATTLTEKIENALREVLEKSPKRNFKQSIEMIITFKEIDPKKPEFKIKENVFLPNAPKKEPEICIVADGDLALQAKNLNVKQVIDKAILDEISKDKKKAKKIAKNCDVILVQTDLMSQVGRTLGPALGPRGKAPIPLPPRSDLQSILERYKKIAIVRIKDQPQIQVKIGTEDNTLKELTENAIAILNVIENKLKTLSNVDAIYFKKAMGPPVKIRMR
jgi:large subunit ribosomal protein L1